MDKEMFGKLFLDTLNQAASIAEKRLNTLILREFLIELHAPKYGGRRVKVNDALNSLYLGGDKFFKIIDVAVVDLIPEQSVVFVRVSGHAPVDFAQTWDAHKLGPFKQMEAAKIEDHR